MYICKYKYHEMNVEEQKEMYRERMRKWYKNLPEDKKKEYIAKQQKKVTGYCECCGNNYANIYQHNNTKMHQKNNNKLFRTE